MADDVLWRIKEYTVAKIKALNLKGDGGVLADIEDRVTSQLLPDGSNLSFPCVVVTTYPEMIVTLGGTTGANQNWMPVVVMIMDRVSPREPGNEKYYLAWGSSIYDAFFHKKLTGVDEVRGCEIQRNPTFDPRLSYFQFLVSGQVLKFFVSQKAV